MILLSLALALLIGSCFIHLFRISLFRNGSALFYSIALICGIAICSFLTYVYVLIAGQWHRGGIIGTSILFALALMIFANRKAPLRELLPRWRMPALLDFWVVLVFVLLAYVLTIVGRIHAFGEWDAWAMWNLKFRFFILSSSPWTTILDELHVYTHPDYPLLLPFWNVWLYSWTGSSLNTVPFISAILFSVLIPTVLFTGLSRLIPGPIALLAAALLGLHPYFGFLSTAQYADVLIALFLLTSILLIVLMLKHEDQNLAGLIGCLLGAMAFTKNEGLVIGGLLIVCLFIHAQKFAKTQRYFIIRAMKPLLIAGALALIPLAVFKIFMHPAGTDMLPELSKKTLEAFSGSRIQGLFSLIAKEFLSIRWCFTWFFLTALVVMKLRAFGSRETVFAALFLFSYFAILFLIYLTGPHGEIQWWITYSFHRILFTLLPSILLIIFIVHFREERS